MDKSLDDLIAEQQAKRNRKTVDRSSSKQETRGRDRPDTRRSDRPDNRRDSRKQDAAGPPPRDSAYFMHDERNSGWGDREQQRGAPRGSWKQQQRQQWDRQQHPRGRGSAAAGTDPIITTADGWEEVAQDEPHTDRRGGAGVQRRGGVFDRLSGPDRSNGAYHTRGWDRRGEQEQQPYGRGGRFARGRGGRGGRGRGDDFDLGGEPRRRYVDEHDHREDYPAVGGSGGRPGRFQPYRVAGGISKPSARGPGTGRNKWSHDLYDPKQQAPAGDEAAAVEGDMME